MMKNCDLSLANAALFNITHYLTQELKELNLTSAVQYVNVRALFLSQYSWGT